MHNKLLFWSSFFPQSNSFILGVNFIELMLKQGNNCNPNNFRGLIYLFAKTCIFSKECFFVDYSSGRWLPQR